MAAVQCAMLAVVVWMAPAQVQPGDGATGPPAAPRTSPGVSVLAFGAVADGTTDSTAAFLDALSSADAVFVPNGTFVVRRTLQLRDGQTLRGAGMVQAKLLCNPQTSLPPSAACVQTIPTPHGGVGSTLRDLTVEFHNNAGANANRGVDLTATSFALLSNVQIVGFHTGLYLSRGAGAGAGSCFFNNVERARFFACKLAVDVNDDVGYSVNNCNFRDLHAADVGVWSNGTGYRITGYGHRFSRLYAGGLEGLGAMCVEFGSPHQSGVSISGDNLIESLYCENGGAAYGIRASAGTGGRGGNHVIGLHMDGAPLVSTLDDPFGVVSLQASGWSLPPGPPGEAQSVGGVPGWRLGQVELYSILGSPAGPPHHLSFWRPEGEQAGHPAGSITSTANGTAAHYNTAADRKLLVPESIQEFEDALDTVVNAPSAKRFRFRAAESAVHAGFIADELVDSVPSAVSNQQSTSGKALGEVDNSKLVPLLWNAVQELSAQVVELEHRLADAGL